LKIRSERLEFTHVWRNEVLNDFLDGLGDIFGHLVLLDDTASGLVWPEWFGRGCSHRHALTPGHTGVGSKCKGRVLPRRARHGRRSSKGLQRKLPKLSKLFLESVAFPYGNAYSLISPARPKALRAQPWRKHPTSAAGAAAGGELSLPAEASARAQSVFEGGSGAPLRPGPAHGLAGDCPDRGAWPGRKLGNVKSSCGRPPALLRFNAAHGYVAAADIGGTRLRMMLADLNGRPVAQWAVAMTDRQKSSRGIVSLVQTGLCAMVQEAGARDRVLHLTVGAPGITDVSRGVVLARPNLAGWNSVPLRKLLEAETASKSRSRTIPTWPR